MRQAELTSSGLLALFSVYLMWKSAELPIGWIKDYGPGGGMFPFYLSLIMLVVCCLIFVLALRRRTPESQTDEPFMSPEAKRLFYKAAGSLCLMILVMGGLWLPGLYIPGLGAYVAIPLFLIFYVRFMGHHSWPMTLALAVGIPAVTFLFFEKLLWILLPKGITDPLFYIFF